MSNPDINLFRDEEFEEVRLTPEKVVCLGVEFESDDARRAYFREELYLLIQILFNMSDGGLLCVLACHE